MVGNVDFFRREIFVRWMPLRDIVVKPIETDKVVQFLSPKQTLLETLGKLENALIPLLVFANNLYVS